MINLAKELKNYSLYLLAIVGIVAVVGIVLMVSGKWSCSKVGLSAETEVTGETLLAEEGGEDLIGNAFSVGSCTDPDANSYTDKNQYLVKSTTTQSTISKTSIKKTDSCGTLCLVANCNGKILNPTSLYEYSCTNTGTIGVQIVDCAAKFGPTYTCFDGACRAKPCPNTNSLVCKNNKLYSASTNPCTGKVVSETLKDDCTAKKGICDNGKCVCTPEYTGNYQCLKTSSGAYYYVKEKLAESC